MIAPDLITSSENIRLFAPNVERDAAADVAWMKGEQGKKTQSLMDVTTANIHEHDNAESQNLLAPFIDSPEEIVWMTEYSGKVVGVVEVHLEPTEYLPSPSIHIMIGDQTDRGQGIGQASLRAAIGYLQYDKAEDFSRRLISNISSANMLLKLGFENEADIYMDAEGLSWQNVVLRELT